MKKKSSGRKPNIFQEHKSKYPLGNHSSYSTASRNNSGQMLNNPPTSQNPGPMAAIGPSDTGQQTTTNNMSPADINQLPGAGADNYP